MRTLTQEKKIELEQRAETMIMSGRSGPVVPTAKDLKEIKDLAKLFIDAWTKGEIE